MYSLVDNPVHLVKRVDMGVFVHIFKIYLLLLLQEQNSFFRFIYLFLVSLGLHCCARAFSNCGEQGLLSATVCRLLTAVASPVVVHGLQAVRLQ